MTRARSHCRSVPPKHPLHARITNIFGADVSGAAVRPQPRSSLIVTSLTVHCLCTDATDRALARRRALTEPPRGRAHRGRAPGPAGAACVRCVCCCCTCFFWFCFCFAFVLCSCSCSCCCFLCCWLSRIIDPPLISCVSLRRGGNEMRTTLTARITVRRYLIPPATPNGY